MVDSTRMRREIISRTEKYTRCNKWNRDGIPLHLKAKTFCIALVSKTRSRMVCVSSYETCRDR